MVKSNFPILEQAMSSSPSLLGVIICHLRMFPIAKTPPRQKGLTQSMLKNLRKFLYFHQPKKLHDKTRL